MKTLVFIGCIFSCFSMHCQTSEKLNELTKNYFPEGSWSGVIGYVDTLGSAVYSFGHEKVRAGEPISQYTHFYLASVTKSFLGLVLLEEIEAGHISAGDTIGKWFPDFSKELKGVTIEQLANHTAAIHDVYSLVEPGTTLDNRIAMVEMNKLDTTVYPSGEKWGYSNSHYILIAEILAIELKVSVDEMFTERIVEPFHVREASLSSKGGSSISGYDERGKPVPQNCRTMGDAGLIVTGNDMANAGQELITNKKWINLLESQSVLADTFDRDTTWLHQFGLFYKTNTNPTFYAYSGKGNGFQTYFRWLASEQKYMFIMSNQYSKEFSSFREEAAYVLFAE